MMTKLVQEGGDGGGEALRSEKWRYCCTLSFGIFRIGRLEAITACFFWLYGRPAAARAPDFCWCCAAPQTDLI